MKMTYNIVYNPNSNTGLIDLNSVDFLCTDDMLHIRLRDYDHEEVIHGFIGKLTYLVTYLMQRTVLSGELSDNIIDRFVKNDESVVSLNGWIKMLFRDCGKNCKGLKISQNYRKKKLSYSKPIGSFLDGTCTLKDEVVYGDIDFILNILRPFNITEFLLNDSIEIVITKEVKKDSYKKYRNKSKKVKKYTLEYISLI